MPRTDGLDVSEFQPNTDWAHVAGLNPNLDFVCAKATQGAGYVDRQFAYNQARLRDQVSRGWSPARTKPDPVVLIWYHFAHTGSPAQQAANFSRVVGPLRPGETVMVDVEDAPNLGIPKYPVPHLQALFAEVAARFDRVPLRYVGHYYFGAGVHPAELESYPWWLPAYVGDWRTLKPSPPTPLIWQWGTPKGALGNPGQDVDNNEVLDRAALLRLAKVPQEDDMPSLEEIDALISKRIAEQDARIVAALGEAVTQTVHGVSGQAKAAGDPRFQSEPNLGDVINEIRGKG